MPAPTFGVSDSSRSTIERPNHTAASKVDPFDRRRVESDRRSLIVLGVAAEGCVVRAAHRGTASARALCATCRARASRGTTSTRSPSNVTGFDDIPVSRIVGPGLTTASVTTTDLGRRAFELLSSDDVDRRVVVRPSLIVRGSTALPRDPHRTAV